MAGEKGRPELYQDNDNTIYPNLNKEINAEDHNAFINDIILSDFNKVDDEVPLLWWDKTNNITLQDKLNDYAEIPVIGGVQVNGVASLLVTGDITNVTWVSGHITVFFNDIGTTDYVVVLEPLNNETSLGNRYVVNKTSNSFQTDGVAGLSHFYDIVIIKY